VGVERGILRPCGAKLLLRCRSEPGVALAYRIDEPLAVGRGQPVGPLLAALSDGGEAHPIRRLARPVQVLYALRPAKIVAAPSGTALTMPHFRFPVPSGLFPLGHVPKVCPYRRAGYDMSPRWSVTRFGVRVPVALYARRALSPCSDCSNHSSIMAVSKAAIPDLPGVAMPKEGAGRNDAVLGTAQVRARWDSQTNQRDQRAAPRSAYYSDQSRTSNFQFKHCLSSSTLRPSSRHCISSRRICSISASLFSTETRCFETSSAISSINPMSI
jgi:hypothetical protein